MERLRCQALVLSTLDYGDADRIVTLLTDRLGRIAAFAAGARKSKRRFAGVLEPFTLLEVQLVERRGDTFRLDAAHVLDGFGELRTRLDRIARASYAAELVRELCRDREPHGDLFALLKAFFNALAREEAGPLALMRFELDALAAAGLMPRLDCCARCGTPGPSGLPLFDSDHGGLLCRPCGQGTGMPISLAAADALGALQDRRRALPSLPDHVRAEARTLLSRFVTHHLGRQLKSLEFMRQVGVEI